MFAKASMLKQKEQNDIMKKQTTAYIPTRWIRQGLVNVVDGKLHLHPSIKTRWLCGKLGRISNREYLEKRSLSDRLSRREKLAFKIEENAQEEMVAIVYGGRDCDMSQWDNRVSYVPATVTHVEKWVDDYMEGAEGPQWWHIEKPSSAKELESSSRDLALEAHEDGHPHVVYA